MQSEKILIAQTGCQKSIFTWIWHMWPSTNVLRWSEPHLAGTRIQRYLHAINMNPCQAEHHGTGHRGEEVGLVTRTRSYLKLLNDYTCNRNLTEYHNNPIINPFENTNLNACPVCGTVTQLWQAGGIFLAVGLASEPANWREETRNQTSHLCPVVLFLYQFPNIIFDFTSLAFYYNRFT